MDNYIPENSKFIACVKDGNVVSSMIEGHKNFFNEVSNIIESYVNLSKTCKDCKRFNFCNHEDKVYYKERSLLPVYKKIIDQFGIKEIEEILTLYMFYSPNMIIDNFLLSGLYTYIRIKKDALDNDKTIPDLQSKLDLIYNALLKEYDIR